MKHTCLSTSYDIVTLENGWQTVSLHRCWVSVASKFDILQHDRMQSSVIEAANGLDSDSALLYDFDLLDPEWN